MKFKRSVTIGATALLVIGGLGLLAAYATAGSNKSGNARCRNLRSQSISIVTSAIGTNLRATKTASNAVAKRSRRTMRSAKTGLLSIVNSCRTGGVNGAFRSSEGKAKIVPESNNAKLKVSFFGPFYVGDYWVLDHADDYTWSIVGEPSGKYLMDTDA